MLCDLSLVSGNVTGKSKNKEGEKTQQKVIQLKQVSNLKVRYLVHHCATSGDAYRALQVAAQHQI